MDLLLKSFSIYLPLKSSDSPPLNSHLGGRMYTNFPELLSKWRTTPRRKLIELSFWHQRFITNHESRKKQLGILGIGLITFGLSGKALLNFPKERQLENKHRACLVSEHFHLKLDLDVSSATTSVLFKTTGFWIKIPIS